MNENKRGAWLQDSEWDVMSLVTGLVVGLILLGGVWLSIIAFGASVRHDGASAQAHDGGALGATRGPASPSSAGSSAGSSALERCDVAAAALQRPLQLARPALDQWDVHIGAMNKLVVGAITLQQATAFWNQTRVGAYHRIGRFNDADAGLAQQALDCPDPQLLGSGAPPALQACAQHVAAELDALQAARTAITTWKHHVDAMDRLRSGQLSPTAATRMWLSMWHRGVQELEQFRGAERAARQRPGCGGTSQTSSPADEGSGPTPSPASSPASSPGSSPGSSPESEMPGMPMG
jgi:hypothetical protein